MKATFYAGLSICLLSVFISGGVAAAAAPDKPASSAATGQAHTAVSGNKASSAKTTATAKKTSSSKKSSSKASKSKKASEAVKNTRLTPTNLDLSLPPEMVRQLQPIGSVTPTSRAPLLPPMFGERPKADSPFQLNGRLLSNEMKLQLRNEERREVEGAALDFEFKQ